MDSTCNNSDDTLSSVEVVSAAIDNLSLITISSNETPGPSKNSDTRMVEQVLLSQSDVNCNKIYSNNCSLMTETRILPDVQSDDREHAMPIPEDFNPANDGGLSCVISTSVVPMDMRLALRDTIHDKVKIDYVIRQNDHTNAQQNSPRMLRSNSLDCVIEMCDSESEDSDFSLDSDDDSTDDDSEFYRSCIPAQRLTSSDDESLGSDGESVESSEYLSDSDEDSNNSVEDSSTDSDEGSSDSDDEPCDSDKHPSDDEPDVSSKDSATTSAVDKPDSTGDEDSGDDDGSVSVNDEESSDHDDEEESSDDDKSIDLGESSDSSNESSDLE